MEAELIIEGIYMVGGPDISYPEDATVFIVDCRGKLLMIDCGAGNSASLLIDNIKETGLDPRSISTLILTHSHVDHIGAVQYFREKYHCKVVAHDRDADAIEKGDPKRTAAGWYGVKLPQTTVDLRLKAEHEMLTIGNQEVHCLHTPGHTPGSIAVYLDRAGQRVLFGQDIHGPFHPEFGSDIGDWRESMEMLIALKADILCEGHFGIYSPKAKVERYIRGYIDRHAAQ